MRSGWLMSWPLHMLVLPLVQAVEPNLQRGKPPASPAPGAGKACSFPPPQIGQFCLCGSGGEPHAPEHGGAAMTGIAFRDQIVVIEVSSLTTLWAQKGLPFIAASYVRCWAGVRLFIGVIRPKRSWLLQQARSRPVPNMGAWPRRVWPHQGACPLIPPNVQASWHPCSHPSTPEIWKLQILSSLHCSYGTWWDLLITLQLPLIITCVYPCTFPQLISYHPLR